MKEFFRSQPAEIKKIIFRKIHGQPLTDKERLIDAAFFRQFNELFPTEVIDFNVALRQAYRKLLKR